MGLAAALLRSMAYSACAALTGCAAIGGLGDYEVCDGACPAGEGGGRPEAGRDAGREGGRDAGRDAKPETGLDGGRDAARDAPSEATPADAPVLTFTVGGAVSGLGGTLVLDDNGTDALTLTKNGSFVFATSLANGSSYDVTVGAQPSGETCTVSSGTGTVMGGNVTDVVVSCSASTGNLYCGSSAACDWPTQSCCLALNKSVSSECVASGASCVMNQTLVTCDGTTTCSGSVCCATFTTTYLKSTSCVASSSLCTATGKDSVEILCQPSDPVPCPGTMKCVSSAREAGYFMCM